MNQLFTRISSRISAYAGKAVTFLLAVLVIVVWGLSGPIFQFSDTWQLVVNTGTTIVTFLMVFLIQKSQNKESKAVQLKLNELISANRFTSNRMVDIEGLTESELDDLRRFYARLSKLAEREEDIHQSHSIDEAEQLENKKKGIQAASSQEKKPTNKRQK